MTKSTKKLCASVLALGFLTNPTFALENARALTMHPNHTSAQAAAMVQQLARVVSIEDTSLIQSIASPTTSPPLVPSPSPKIITFPTPTPAPTASPLPAYAINVQIDMKRAETVTDIRYTADFAYLRNVSPEVVGYLIQDGTPIMLPIVQGTRNSDYTNRTFNNNISPKGTVFMDVDSSAAYTDDITYLYGSRSKNGGDFSSLYLYSEQSYYAQHPSLRLLTPFADYQVDFFAGFSSTMGTSETWRMEHSEKNQSNSENFASYIAGLQAQSTFQVDAPKLPEPGDRLLALVAYQQLRNGECYVLFGRMRPIRYETDKVQDIVKREMDSLPTGNGYVEVGSLGSFMIYGQNDEIWAKMRYESTFNKVFRNFGQGGCGPTALAMAVANLVPTEELPKLIGYANSSCGFSFCSVSVNSNFCRHNNAQYVLKTPEEFLRYLPIAFANFATGNNLWQLKSRVSGIQGTNTRFWSLIASIYHLDMKVTNNVQEALEALKQKNCIVLSCTIVDGPFTSSGHYVVLAGVDEEYLYVLDPLRRKSYKSWDRYKILELLTPGVVRVKLEDVAKCCFTSLHILQRMKP